MTRAYYSYGTLSAAANVTTANKSFSPNPCQKAFVETHEPLPRGEASNDAFTLGWCARHSSPTPTRDLLPPLLPDEAWELVDYLAVAQALPAPPARQSGKGLTAPPVYGHNSHIGREPKQRSNRHVDCATQREVCKPLTRPHDFNGIIPRCFNGIIPRCTFAARQHDG